MVEILLLLLITTETDPHNSSVMVWIKFQRGEINCAGTLDSNLHKRLIIVRASEYGLLNGVNYNLLQKVWNV